MFADDTNLFISGVNVGDLFSDVNCELNKISLWFRVNKLSLNLAKTKYSLFHPASKKRFLREPLPFLKIDILSLKGKMLQNFLYLLMKISNENST